MKQPQSLASGPATTDLAGQPTPERGAADFWTAAGSVIALQNQMPPLRRVHTTAPIPLSLAQERLWSLEQSEPGAPYYHIPLTWEIEGELDVSALEKSINFLLQRHEALRATFPSRDSGPLQQINDDCLTLTVEDLSGQPANESRAESWKRATELVQAPMDLEKGPLVRMALYRWAEKKAWLVAVFHQMILDGASMRILNRELGACYTAFAAGRKPSLDPLPISYADFSRWQLDCARQSQHASDFWQSRLQKEYEPLRLPADLQRNPIGPVPAAHLPFSFPKPLMDALKELALAKGVTPFAAFLGSFQAYLARQTNQDDVLTFASMAARTHPGLRNIVGLVANVLPLRLDLSKDPTFDEVLGRSAEVVASALANQSVPLSEILEHLTVTPGDTPALQTLIIYNNAPLQALKLSDTLFQPSLELDNGTAKFDFTLDVADSPQGVTGFLKYRTDLYRKETVQSLMNGWETFLRKAVAEPGTRLSAISVDPIKGEGVSLESSRRGSSHCSRAATGGLSCGRVTNRIIAYVPPETPAQKKLAAIWEKVFGVGPIGINDNFFGLGGHSLAAVKLVSTIEKETGKKLRLCTIFQQPTIARLAQVLEDSRGRVEHSIVEIQPIGSQPPLFLVHGVGGGMFWGYNNLARELGPDQPLYGFKSRGLEGLEEFGNIEQIAAQYVADLLKFRPRGPYYLGGYCFGGNVAYEMARQLRAEHHEVALLLLINCWANNSSYTRVKLSPGLVLPAMANFLVRLAHQVRHAVRNPRDFFKWRAAWFARRMKSLLLSEPEDRLSVEDIVNLSTQSDEERKLWRTHVQAWLKYRPKPYQGEVVLFRTRGHPLVCSFDHKMGWGDLAQGGVTVKVCPGDHESILEEENVARVASELQGIIEQLPGSVAPENQPLARAIGFTKSDALACIPSAPSTI